MKSKIKPLKSDTGEKPAPDRVYIPDPDYREPKEDVPTITREENKND